MDDPQIIYQSHSLRATLHKAERATGKLLCEFDYLNNARTGFPDIRPTPTLCSKGFSVLTVDTSLNNWFLSDDVPELGQALSAIAKDYDSSVAMTFSMGIMPALMFSKQLRLQKILAFSPVISIFEDDISDKRFKSFRKHCTNPEYRNLWKDGVLDIEGSLCFDPFVPIDALQARLIHSYYPKLHPVAMPFGGHPCIRTVKETLGFDAVQNLIIDDHFDPKYPRDLHRTARMRSEIYKNELKKRCSS